MIFHQLSDLAWSDPDAEVRAVVRPVRPGPTPMRAILNPDALQASAQLENRSAALKKFLSMTNLLDAGIV